MGAALYLVSDGGGAWIRWLQVPRVCASQNGTDAGLAWPVYRRRCTSATASCGFIMPRV